MFTSSLIQRAYELTANSNTRDTLHYERKVRELLDYNKRLKGRDLLIPLSFYDDFLNNTHASMFPYMTEEKKNETLRDLQVTYLFYLSQLGYELEHQKKENSKDYQEKLKHCQDLIDALLYPKVCAERQTQPSPEQAYFSDGRPAAYTGLVAGQVFAEEMVKMSSGSTTKTIRNKMGWVNDKRLYWVWASSFLKTTLSLLPDDFFNIDQANKAIKTPDLYTGTMSWGLYYFRFALNLGLLLKHTIAGPWMSKEEKSEGTWERFKTQWAQRKFNLLNDSIWATGNLLCFFLLYGSGAAGAWGDVLTIGLLVFDITLAFWDYHEQKTQHEKQVNDYVTAITELQSQAEKLKLGNDTLQRELDELMHKLKQAGQEKLKIEQEIQEKQKKIAEQEQALIELNLKSSALKRAKDKCAREWNYQKMNLVTGVVYACGLMLAFAMLAMPFLPAIAAVSAVGSALCFTLSLINNAVKSGIELHKMKMTAKELRAEQEERINAFKALSALPFTDDNAKRLMFLEVKKLRIDSEHQEKMIAKQTVNLMRSILIESMIPPLVFLSFVMLPLGAGLGILAASFAFAVATHLLIERIFKEDKPGLNKLEEKEYEEFCADPDNWDKKSNSSAHFFKGKKATAHDKGDEQTPFLLSDGHSSPAA